jgi:hypothetical protein
MSIYRSGVVASVVSLCSSEKSVGHGRCGWFSLNKKFLKNENGKLYMQIRSIIEISRFLPLTTYYNNNKYQIIIN